MSDCWYIPEKVEDPRAENRLTPNVPGSYEKLAEVNVFYKRYDPNEISDDVEAFITPFLKHINYQHFDVVNLNPSVLGEEKFDSLASQHFEEHLHEDDEVRLVIGGTGYFDIRSKEDKWIRVLVGPGDAVVVPAGIYHRFTTTPEKNIRTVRLFKTNPRWLAVPRGPKAKETEARKQFLKNISSPRETVCGTANAYDNNVFTFRFPLEMDNELNKVMAHYATTHKGDQPLVAIVFVMGSVDPLTGKSWCPPCAEAKPVVNQAVDRLRHKYGAGNTLYIELPVERPAYLGNPSFFYRKHPFLQIQSVPTVIVSHLKRSTAPTSPWYELLEEKLRTLEPEVNAIASS
uniref:Acireductone dioxygenase n=1 Tax=Angomonas deanei TaxID=59799 RepID=U5KL61_9TRYP|nr:iron(II)-requiring acireductone dioxygenase [Angomonas deanei]